MGERGTIAPPGVLERYVALKALVEGDKVKFPAGHEETISTRHNDGAWLSQRLKLPFPAMGNTWWSWVELAELGVTPADVQLTASSPSSASVPSSATYSGWPRKHHE